MQLEIENFLEFIAQHQKDDINSSFDFNGRDARFRYTMISKDKISKLLTDVKAQFSFPNDTEVIVSIESSFANNHYLYLGNEDFINRYKSSIDFDKSVYIILDKSGNYLMKDQSEVFTKQKAIFFNRKSYNDILNLFLYDKELTSYVPDIENQFVLISPDTENPLHVIGYNTIEKSIASMANDLTVLYSELVENFKQPNYRNIFKDRVLVACKGVSIEESFIQIINSLRLLINEADLNYQIYIKKFAFDKISKEFKEKRNKYFENLEKNIDTVSKQVTSFPLTFSASAFASYQVKDKPLILLMIWIVYALYTAIVWYLLYISWANVKQIDGDLIYEKAEMKKYGDKLFAPFEKDIELVEIKISRLRWLIGVTVFVFLVMLGLFAFFSCSQNGIVVIKP